MKLKKLNLGTFRTGKRDESKHGIKTLPPFLKNITEENDLENFQDLILALDACYWLHKVISISLAIRRRSKVRFQPILGGDFQLLRRF